MWRDLPITATPAAPAREFVPSPQQAGFFKWQIQGRGSAILEAVAGAGKSTTLAQGINNIPAQETLAVMMYNKAAEIDFRAKVTELCAPARARDVGTCHGFGMYYWMRACDKYSGGKIKCEVDDAKVKKLILAEAKNNPDIQRYVSFITKMVSFGKAFLMGVPDPRNEKVTRSRAVNNLGVWKNLALHFGADQELPDDVPMEVAMADVVTIFEQSKALCRTVIDFDDMIYAPLAFNARFFQVDWVMIDECQDINPARRELARRMLKPGGRLVAVGDSRQAIYGFTGAGADALERIAIEFGCKRLPLTVTYRCPKAVVAYVQQWVKHIEAHESAPEGCVRAPMLDKVGEGLPKPRPWFESEGLRAGDAVLCRYTLPLIKQAYNMLRAGRACKVEGREIGKGLENLATRWKVKSLDVLENRLAKFLAKEVAKAKAADNERAAEEIRDRVASLQVFIERTRTNGHNTIEELVLEIQALFADDVKGVPVLCTGHKSKGREWHRVYWMQTTLRQKNLQDWQLVQEANLKYVMATRAKSELILLPEGM